MIHLPHNSYTISPTQELNSRWTSIVVDAALAYAAGQDIIGDQLKNTVRNSYNEWKTKAQAEAKRKTNVGWLGDGDCYTVSALDPLVNFDSLVQGIKQTWDNGKIQSEFNRMIGKYQK